MKILFTADLHINIPARHPRTGRTNLDALAEEILTHSPDAVVVAGDISLPERSSEHVSALRKAVGDRPLAFCLGNHDHWISPEDHFRFPNLQRIRDNIWEPSADAIGAVLLDSDNAYWSGVTICGGYGHFDLGHAEPELRIWGQRITRQDYLSGGFGGSRWNDFTMIPGCADRLGPEAKAHARGISKRLAAATADKHPIIVVTHTCPWKDLNAHPLRGSEQDLFHAYSGNSLVGDMIACKSAAVDLLVCGHTHRPVRETTICGVRSLNIGADYGVFRGTLYDTETRSIKWIGEPF